MVIIHLNDLNGQFLLSEKYKFVNCYIKIGYKVLKRTINLRKYTGK